MNGYNNNDIKISTIIHKQKVKNRGKTKDNRIKRIIARIQNSKT